MPVRKDRTIQQLIGAGRFDEAVEQYQSKRKTEIALGEKADSLINNLNEQRKRLNKNSEEVRKQIKELQAELEKLKEESGSFSDFIGTLFGDDNGAASVDSQTIVTALHREVMEQTVFLVLDVLSAGDNDDPDHKRHKR